MIADVMEGTWRLPISEKAENAFGTEEVCVVGVFGKSVWGHTSKSLVINKLASTSAYLPHYFSYTLHSDVEKEASPSTFLPSIDCYYDKEKRIVYLHLTTVLDAAALSAACVQMGDKLNNRSDCHYFWKSQEVETVFALVYLFSVCHILVLVHPVPTFDITFDKLFHHVGNMRVKLLPFIKDVLKECSVGRDWWVNGRPCPPRLLFIIHRCDLCPPKASADSSYVEGTQKKKKPPLKRLQHTLEDQVYKILRNSRVLTNNAVNCLFTVPPNQAFVHIMTDQFDKVKNEEDPVKSMLLLLRKSCETHRNPTTRPRAYRLLTNPPQWTDPNEGTDDNPLWSFLSQHTDLVLNKKGFKDSVGRNPLPTHFEIPQFKNWIKVANNLSQLFFTQPKLDERTNDSGAESKAKVQDKIADIRSALHVGMDPEARFSEARCSKLVSLASAAYQSNLPLHYTSKVHNNQLSQALATYKLHARGPARDKYELCVQDECEAFWNDGRRLCEVRSLTGRHCIHRFHDLPAEGKPQPDLNPPKMYHSSRSRSIVASSCGRTQGSREDPFTLKDANYDFYKRLDSRAPSLSESDIFRFPIYVLEKVEKPLVSAELHSFIEQLSLNAAESSEVATEENNVGKEASQSRNSRVEDQESDQNSTQESETEANEEEESKDDDRPRTTSATFDFSLNSETMPDVQSVDYNNEHLLKQQPFIDGMVHSGTPEGVLPLFSSWSLVRIGSASSYSSSRGLDMPGFIPGTNHLVPWDIMFQTEDPNITQWPVPGEARKMPIKDTKLIPRETTTRAFVGYDYETPRGQRFICSSPDKAIKVSNSGVVKDTIQPLLDLDMPLFTTSPVSGRSGKMLLGQLMRIIIVTPPESNVHITIRPQVVPGPPPAPTFHPSQPEVTLRHNSMWVLRFPYVYVSDSGSHQPPKDAAQLSAWRCLKMLSMTVDN